MARSKPIHSWFPGLTSPPAEPPAEPSFDWAAFSAFELEVGSGDVTVVDGQLRLNCEEWTGWDHPGSWAQSPADAPYSLWDTSITAHWDIGDLADPRETGLYLYTPDPRDNFNRISIGTDGVQLYLTVGRIPVESAAHPASGSIDYTPWWRITHDATAEEIRFATSDDGATWTDIWTFPPSMSYTVDGAGWTEEVLTNLTIVLAADRWDTADEPFYVYVDHLE